MGGSPEPSLIGAGGDQGQSPAGGAGSVPPWQAVIRVDPQRSLDARHTPYPQPRGFLPCLPMTSLDQPDVPAPPCVNPPPPRPPRGDQAAEDESVGIRQYSAATVLGLWAAVTAPMAGLAFAVGPLLAPHLALQRGLLHWVLMVVGMMWQFVLSVVLLKREGPLTWASVRGRIRLNAPRAPRGGATRARLWWWVVPVLVVNLGLGYAAGPLDDLWSRITGLQEPAWAAIRSLADPQFVGQWWIVALALVSAVFNYVLGEELFFHGILLPRMRQAFGRWDWVVNTVLFGLYHVHKIWFWPSMVIGSLGLAWAARRYRSLWMSIIVHGVEAVFVVLVVAVVAGWWLP